MKTLKKICVIMNLLITLFLLSSCKCDFLKKKYEITYFSYFDTITTIIGYENNKKDFIKNSDFIEEKLNRYNQLYDIYHEYVGVNNICTINKNAGIEPVKVDKEIIELLTFAKEMYNITNGMINIAMGSVLKLWHEARIYSENHQSDAYIPSNEELKLASYHTNIDSIIIDKDASTVYIDDKSTSIDVGAIAKGYATEQIAKLLIEKNVTSYTLDVGGNIRTVGGKKNNKWNIGIKNPDLNSNDTTIKVIKVDNLAVVTSGTYQRYYVCDGKIYHHIISPISLYPENLFSSITVIANDSGLADGLSTALFNMSLDEGEKIINNLNGVEAMWIDSNYNIYYSNHFLDYTK